MAEAGRIELDDGAQHPVLRIRGDWTLEHYAALTRAMARLAHDPRACEVDLDGLGALDTAGASLLARLLGPERVEAVAITAPRLPDERRNLLQAVAAASARAEQPPAGTPRTAAAVRALGALGARVSRGAEQARLALGFMGQVLAVFARGLLHPRRWRLAAVSAQLQHTALAAVPIVALLTFAVGAVMALLGITVLQPFGAGIYTTDLVGYAFLREFGVVITAILLAGRSASAFTAQIGSMKANEELDAMRAQGLDPLEMLVAPRIVALVLAVPLLTVVAVASGLAGGAGVIALNTDATLTRVMGLYGEIPVSHYLVGMVKAPVFAFVIAAIGCLEGLKAGGSAQSVGTHTTSAVVQSIFWVIILDALFALAFVEVGW